MPITLEPAVVYDIETLPNVFTLAAEMMNYDARNVWEISHWRDDRRELMQWFEHLRVTQCPMIGFNSIAFDYPVCHFIYTNPNCTVEEIYAKAQHVIHGDRFANTIWERDRFAPQVDLFKVHHFDNRAKTTSLKALQINMRLASVVDSPIPFNIPATRDQIDRYLIPYNFHDVSSTKKFAHVSKGALDFRLGLVDQFGLDALNFNDTKIGGKILEQRLGEAVCFDRSSGRKVPRQTPRYRIALADIIFPYIRFEHPEFRRVLDYMREQVLTPDDLDDPDAPIKTKGVFSALSAHVGGIDFHFGTGGIHGSVTAQRVVATDEWLIRDIDVAALYPSISIVNRLAPAHLGDAFVTEYAKIPEERQTHAKGTYQNAALKLAANGTYGNSNNKFSIFYDPQFTMTITINGQLMLCMLAEWLCTVPTVQLIQINTDGVTYRVHRDYLGQCKALENQWEAYTCLTLEDASYRAMWIRDVNNYIAQDTKGKLKQKGAYWHPDPANYAQSLSLASPPAWYKDLSAIVCVRAAVTAMVHGIDPGTFIRAHTDPFDFMCRARATGGAELQLGGVPVQRTMRYYVATQGAALTKHMPAMGPIGQYKRKSGVSEAEYARVMATLQPGEWCEAIHTKNKSRYETRTSNVEAGWNVADCNDAADFKWSNVNYDYYISEARKLIIS